MIMKNKSILIVIILIVLGISIYYISMNNVAQTKMKSIKTNKISPIKKGIPKSKKQINFLPKKMPIIKEINKKPSANSSIHIEFENFKKLSNHDKKKIEACKNMIKKISSWNEIKGDDDEGEHMLESHKFNPIFF